MFHSVRTALPGARILTAVPLAVALCGWTARVSADTGAEIYQQRCAVCHGAAGEGTAAAPTPLIGDKSIAELSAVIAATMPQDAPGTCTGADAEHVAAYLHDEFYSPIAQARRHPPRVEFSRLKIN